jgi:hypothetical protein
VDVLVKRVISQMYNCQERTPLSGRMVKMRNKSKTGEQEWAYRVLLISSIIKNAALVKEHTYPSIISDKCFLSALHIYT